MCFRCVKVRAIVKLDDCLASFAQQEVVESFWSSAAKASVNALKSTRLASFPDYLLVQARKFEHAADWTPIKLDVALQVPAVLDIGHLRGTGLKADEAELPNDTGDRPQQQQAPAVVVLNEAVVGQLVDMGFSLGGARRAAYHTREAGDGESAVNWAVAHMEDADFNADFEVPAPAATPATTTTTTTVSYNEESIESIVSWGFTRKQAMKALDATSQNLERAADWIFSHADDLATIDDEAATTTTATAAAAATTATAAAAGGDAKVRDGEGVYDLLAFISHMGRNANVGHYVAHIRKPQLDGKWAIFNDENVAVSEQPPVELAYLYVYKRRNL